MNRSRPLMLPRWCLALMLAVALLPCSTQAQTAPRYFSQTGHYLAGAFRFFWEHNGGLRIFGYPITEEYIRNADGRIVQYFERARFELIVRNNQPIVELGQLGREVTASRSFPQSPPFTSTKSRIYFAQTGHSLQGAFKSAWEGNGGLGIFGYPISEEINEQLSDGRVHLVQYFERQRFELWPDGVRFALLGRDLAPQQLLEPWPSNVSPGAPLSEDGIPRPPGAGANPPGLPAGRLAVRANPDTVTIGQAFTIEGQGFQAGEPVSLWLTAPNQSVRSVDSPSADGNGSISGARVHVTTDNSFQPGLWLLTGQGVKSGRAAVAQLRINAIPGDSSKLGIRLQEDLAVRGNGQIVPLAATPGVAFTFRAYGFDPAEEVGVWLTPPQSSDTEALDSRLIQNDGRGNLTIVFGTASQREGIWLITAQGKQTRRAVTAPFKLTRDYVAPLGTPRPPNVHGAVSPAEGGRQAIFRLTATGFRANEPVENWITSPDGVYYVAENTTADRSGRLGYSRSLSVRFGISNPAGVYGYHYRGLQSGARADLYLTYTGAP